MILRLYSKNTLEEKILKLAKQNVYVDSRLQTLSRIACHALLMWGAKDLFKKLEIFHGKSGKEISSEERFLKDVMEEFLCVISGKGLKDGGKSLITRLQSCGYYGNKNIPGQLADGEQPHEFWRDLLEGKNPTWKYVSVSTSRQRKRPQYREDSLDVNAPISEVVKRRKRSPTLKPVIEKEIGWVNDGAFSESRSPSGGSYWSAVNAKSLPDLLKPTVFELCNLLKFPVDVKNIVDSFLDFVLDNYTVSKDHTSTLQAFMLSLCWIGALLTNHKIDKKSSFSLAKKHFNFHCKEEEANAVYLKLEGAKEIFLKQTESQEKDDESEPPGQPARTESTKRSTESQHDQNVVKSETREYNEENPEVSEKEKEIEKFKREWDEKRAILENDYEVEKAMIRMVHKNPSTRSEKLKGVDKVFERKFEEHEREKEICLKELKATTLLAAEGQVADDNEVQQNHESSDMSISVEKIDGEGVKVNNNELPENHADMSISVENPDGGVGKMTDMPLEVDGGPSKEKGSLGGGDDNESTGSHTSETEMVVTEEIPPRKHDAVDDDVEVVLVEEVSEKEDGEIEDNVEENIEKVEHVEVGTSSADVAHVESGETGVPGGDADKENSDDSHGGEDNNDSCSSSSNQLSAGVPQDDTPSVQLPASQPPDHPVETQNGSLQEQVSDPQTQDKEGQVDPITSPEMDVDNPPVVDTQINPMAENQSDTNPQNDANAPEAGLNVEQNQPNVPASDTVNNQQTIEQPPVTPTQNTTQHILTIYDVEVPTRVPPHGDPLQAELERLCAVKDKFVKFHEDTKVKLKTECDKEIAEMIAKIKAKYEAKYVEEEATFQLRKKEIDTTVNKVAMNKILADAFRAKCQDLTSSGTQMPKASQAGLMQQLYRIPVRPSLPVASSSSSPSQPSGRQQTPPPQPPPPSSPPPPPPPPPLQIVHQPSALFSNRPSPTTVRSPPTNTPNYRPPPVINPVTPTTRPPPTITPNNRPPPVITPVTPTTRPPPNITPVGSLRGPSPLLRPLLNTEIRAAAPNLRPPSVSTEIRAMAPHLRHEVRAPAPPFTPATSASNEFTPVIRKVPPGHQVTTPVNPQPPSPPPPLPTTTTQLPPLPPETSYVPPPPPPQSQSPPPPPPPTESPPPPSSETEVINCSSPEYEILDITDIFPDVKVKPSFNNKHTSSSKHDDVVYLSDDD